MANTATDTSIIENIISNAQTRISNDGDCWDIATIVPPAIQSLLINYVKLIPNQNDKDFNETKYVLCRNWLAFRTIMEDEQLGGSRLDYAMTHVLEAMDGYSVGEIYNTDAMIKEVEDIIMKRGLYPEREISELQDILSSF